MGTLRNGDLYAPIFGSKYITDARNLNGRLVPLPFEVTIVSAVNGDSYNLTVVPANWKVVGMDCVTDLGLGASVTLQVGDSGNASRFAPATAFGTANLVIPLAGAGEGFKPSADTIVVAVIGGAGPTVGRTFKGCFYCIAPA